MTQKSERRRKLPVLMSDDPLEDDRGLSKRKLRQLCAQAERAVGIGRLESVKGTLRSAVAEAIHRKRAPELCFEVFKPEN